MCGKEFPIRQSEIQHGLICLNQTIWGNPPCLKKGFSDSKIVWIQTKYFINSIIMEKNMSVYKSLLHDNLRNCNLSFNEDSLRMGDVFTFHKVEISHNNVQASFSPRADGAGCY